MSLVDLSGNKQVSEDAIMEALDNAANVSTLDLSNCRLGRRLGLLERIVQAVAENSTVTRLRLGANQIDDLHAQILADALRANSTLTALGLGHNCVTDKGAKYLAEALHSNASLQVLGLGDNPITRTCLTDFAKALEYNGALQVLDSGRVVKSPEIVHGLNRNKNKRVVLTLDCIVNQDGLFHITCLNMGGSAKCVVKGFSDQDKLGHLRDNIASSLTLSVSNLYLLLPSGRLLDTEQNEATLADVL